MLPHKSLCFFHFNSDGAKFTYFECFSPVNLSAKRAALEKAEAEAKLVEAAGMLLQCLIYLALSPCE